jgi:hypothetical protein
MFGACNHKHRSPAKAGVHFSALETGQKWVPAFAGKRIFLECWQ